MARKKLKPCSKFGCNNLTRERYCENHIQLEEEARAAQDKFYDENIRNKKDIKYKIFYHSKEWKMARLRRLSIDNGLCQQCLSNKHIVKADVVHHKVPIKADWSKRLDIDNLISWCHNCHNADDH